jgi:hypothetical protein
VGVWDSAGSHRRSESIGTNAADNQVYGPVLQVVSIQKSTFFTPNKIETAENAESAAAELNGLIIEFDPWAALELPE